MAVDRRLYRLMSILTITVASVTLHLNATAETSAVKIGIVLMHGRGGSPTKHVSDLAAALGASANLNNRKKQIKKLYIQYISSYA